VAKVLKTKVKNNSRFKGRRRRRPRQWTLVGEEDQGDKHLVAKVLKSKVKNNSSFKG
jgi:hypothetical protein